MTAQVTGILKWAALCVVVFFIGIYGGLIWPRVLYQKGGTQLRLKAYERAVDYFKRAEDRLPGRLTSWIGKPDVFRINTNQGVAFYQLGVERWRAGGMTAEVFDYFVRAKSSLEKASAIEADHYLNAYWRARAEAALETAYPVLHPGEANPFDAVPYLRHAMALRPSGISIRYIYARYLYQKGMQEEIPELVRYMVSIYPGVYENLRDEPFFNEAMEEAVAQGLEAALDNRRLETDALKMLSRLAWDQGDHEKAFLLYREAVEEPETSDRIYLGCLLMDGGQRREGFESLFQVLNDVDQVSKIYDFFRRTGRFDDFIAFSFQAAERGLGSVELDLGVARSLMETDRLPFARAKLLQVIAGAEDARAYALLAEVAEREGDWEAAAERMGQAVMLQPGKAAWQYRLSRALENTGRFREAKLAAQKAAALSPGNSAYIQQETKLEKIR